MMHQSVILHFVLLTCVLGAILAAGCTNLPSSPLVFEGTDSMYSDNFFLLPGTVHFEFIPAPGGDFYNVAFRRGPAKTSEIYPELISERNWLRSDIVQFSEDIQIPEAQFYCVVVGGRGSWTIKITPI